jgi:hypothetical protein
MKSGSMVKPEPCGEGRVCRPDLKEISKMAKIRETEVERDAEGRVLVSREHVTEEKPRRKGGFGWGMLLGILVIAVAIIAFAYNQGSFQQAGVEADQATAQVEEQAGRTAETAGDAIQNAGDQVESAGDRAANETSDTATN